MASIGGSGDVVGAAGGGLGPERLGEGEGAPRPEIAEIGERRDVLRRIPWRAEIRALIEAEHRLYEARDIAVSTFRALLGNPLSFREERARLLAERDPGIEIRTGDGRELVTNEMAEGGRYVKLYRPSGREPRPVDITEFEIGAAPHGGIEVQLGVHDTRGPLGFRNADLVARTLAEAGAIVDAAQASPLAHEDARSLPRLDLLEGKLAEVAGAVARLEREMRTHPELRDVRAAYRAALDVRAAGDPNDRAFEEASARVRAALPRLGLAPDLERLARAELDLCRAIRDKWVEWHAATGTRVVILPNG
jgi:hypothetical protein